MIAVESQEHHLGMPTRIETVCDEYIKEEGVCMTSYTSNRPELMAFAKPNGHSDDQYMIYVKKMDGENIWQFRRKIGDKVIPLKYTATSTIYFEIELTT